jgi:acetoacetyl-[acyl-carrier protein] synthase
VLFDDDLVMETGATVYGAVNDIFIHADGYKKSITGPGLGNYLTVAKALAATRNVIGEQRTQRNSFVQAHGTGTPQNRVSESEILNRLAATFGIEKWPVAAVKSQLGHSVASASGDQIIASLGAWSENILPEIAGVDQIADDVATEHLDFLLEHRELAPESMDAALINAKGFGGNNATASILSPHVTRRMLTKRHGKKTLVGYTTRNESIIEEQERYNTACSEGKNQSIYKFDHGVLTGEDLAIDKSAAQLSNGSPAISLSVPHHFSDMCD